MGVLPGESGEAMSGAVLRRCCLVGLVLAMFFPGGWISAAQEASHNDGFLLGALVRTRDLIDRTAADLQKVNRDIQENDRVIGKAGDIIAIARQKNNTQAESVARDALQKAQEARKKNEETRARLELTRSRAAASYAAIRNMLAASPGSGPDSQIRGMVSTYSGNVQIARNDGERFDLDNTSPGFLRPGDRITTGGSSSAVVQTLDGRGTVQLGEYSELSFREDTPEKQALELVRGKSYSAVDNSDDFQKLLQDKIDQYGDDLRAVPGVVQASFRRWARKFEIRTGDAIMSVRGTKFAVELKNDGTTEVTVLEGAVETSDLKGEKQVLVEEGFRVIATKDGISKPQKIVDLDKWWDKQAGEPF
jgi:ferric-dicitrate binding protein FerR (iron transport regulator)